MARKALAMHPATASILRYFEYDHLPAGPMREVSRVFHILANGLAEITPSGAETTAGLRRLLEAKDCFVRAHLPARD
jgi:hypothetical protein